MKKADADLDRLLRSAATAAPVVPEMPYGFETRVVALWRAGLDRTEDVMELTRFLRGIGAVALAIVVIASVSAYRQSNDNEALATPHANEYAIADDAIQTEFSQ